MCVFEGVGIFDSFAILFFPFSSQKQSAIVRHNIDITYPCHESTCTYTLHIPFHSITSFSLPFGNTITLGWTADPDIHVSESQVCICVCICLFVECGVCSTWKGRRRRERKRGMWRKKGRQCVWVRWWLFFRSPYLTHPQPASDTPFSPFSLLFPLSLASHLSLSSSLLSSQLWLPVPHCLFPSLRDAARFDTMSLYDSFVIFLSFSLIACPRLSYASVCLLTVSFPLHAVCSMKQVCDTGRGDVTHLSFLVVQEKRTWRRFLLILFFMVILIAKAFLLPFSQIRVMDYEMKDEMRGIFIRVSRCKGERERGKRVVEKYQMCVALRYHFRSNLIPSCDMHAFACVTVRVTYPEWESINHSDYAFQISCVASFWSKGLAP